MLRRSILYYAVVRGVATDKSKNNLIGPAVRLLLHHYNINEAELSGSGPKKNILKSDVVLFVNERKLQPVKHTSPAVPSSPSPPPQKKPIQQSLGPYVDIPLTNMRKTIAKRLSQSKHTIPHEYVSVEIEDTELQTLRSQLKNDGIALSVNDFVVKAAALALRAVPEVNVIWSGDSIVPHRSVDISVAVATPSGLITPIVFDADEKEILTISQNIRELAKKAKDNSLQPHEFQGGSFTVSNLGMFGVSSFTAIINPPQAAILTVGSSLPSLNDKLQLVNKFSLVLCYDGRCVSSSTASSFVSVLASLLSSPSSFAISSAVPRTLSDLL